MIGRRRFLHCSLCATGGFLIGCDGAGSAMDAGPCDLAFAGGTRLGVMSFVDEDVALETRLAQGWDGRLYTDLSRLDADRLIVSNESHYIRTFFPDLLDTTEPWRIELGGLVETPVSLSLDDLAPLAEDQGVHVLECSGNSRRGGFGLLSAAAWGGAPLRSVLELATLRPEATRVLVSGFDEHSVPSAGGHSTPGASWIFGLDQIDRAFLATSMNGEPLPPDHGAPVRLFVPGWYGCTCIKWVDEIRLVGEDEPATSQMMEFASRTHQDGTPALAREYIPAALDQAAMPVRIEKWSTAEGLIRYRVIGILWGGSEPTSALSFDDGVARTSVDVCPAPTQNSMWTIWQHAWSPPAPGDYPIRMAIDDPSIRTRRLDSGYYERVVRIDEV
jgi:DMSO/TMAO reductase YedYZ molybdopterin-dependent catalytic subunit